MSSFLDKYDSAFVSAFDQEYRNTEVGQSGVKLPAGNYQFAVTDVKVIEKGNLDREGLEGDAYYEHMLVLELTVLSEGAYKGAKTSKFHGLCLKSVKGIKSDLSALGHDFEGLEKLALDIERGSMIGLVVDGKVTEKASKRDPNKSYSNIWLNRTVGRMSGAELAQGAFTPVADDDELPWA